MKGSFDIIVKNNRIRYSFTIQRNITILRGDSATGKTTMIEMISEYEKDGCESGVEVVCDKNCVVLDRRNWERDIEEYRDSIVFIDEGNSFVKSKAFAEKIKGSGNYYVIATRDSLFNLPYSIEEIYGIKNVSGNRYQGTKRLYSELYHLYNKDAFPERPEKVVIEDTNSAYQFFKELCAKEQIVCESAGGKSGIYRSILESKDERILVIADGAAFGPEMERVMSLNRVKRMACFLPESFEWLILRSGLVKKKELQSILKNPSIFIESEKYFSWEQLFTKLLVDATQDTYLTYTKKKLNPAYLHDGNCKMIVKGINEVSGEKLFDL